jgi:chaperone BCS1
MSDLISLLSSAIQNGQEPQKLFEMYIPGFRAMRIFFIRWFGMDLTTFLRLGFFGMLWMTTGRNMMEGIYDHFLGYFTSTISIPADDRVNKEVMKWMSELITKRKARFLNVESTSSSSSHWKSGYISGTDRESLREALNSGGLMDLKTRPVNYLPALGKVYFLFEGRPFLFDLLASRWHDNRMVPNGDEPILIRCLGRNPAPLKRFLDHCREYSLQSKQSMTTIYTAGPEKYGVGLAWREASIRPIRPLNTIDLEEGIKQDMLRDVERYLHPSTRLFYARRGIPYRRGYLFYGPPGTGKTSFSLALAGHFDIDLYMVSLASRNLDDAGLAKLFNALPMNCIVLLEDIDSAGIEREKKESKDSERLEDSANTDKSDDSDASDASEQDENKKKKKKRTVKGRSSVSLSGLLNTIDGAAAQEGRMLIMTSNTPETLDAALIRHGRIDRQIKFDNISKYGAKQLFLRIFSFRQDEQINAEPTSDLEEPHKSVETPPDSQEEHVRVLEKLATEFASTIPERMLSPAEIQGFLLDYRDNAEEALTKMSSWIEATLKTRSKFSKE